MLLNAGSAAVANAGDAAQQNNQWARTQQLYMTGRRGLEGLVGAERAHPPTLPALNYAQKLAPVPGD